MNSLYRTLVEVVERETLAGAAMHLHLTQPSVTRQLQQLERVCGVALFDRIGRRLVLNAAGQRVYETARQVLALERRMEDELREIADPDTGTVTVGAGLTPSIYLLPPVFAAYRAAHPRVQFQVRSGSSKEVLAMLYGRDVDIGVVTTAPAGPELQLTPLVPDQLLLVAAPAHPLATTAVDPDRTPPLPPAGVCFSDLAQWPVVLMRAGSGLRALTDSLAAKAGIRLQTAMETDSLESINRLVQHGVGLSVLPTSAVRDDLASGRLVAIPVSDMVLPSRTVTLVTRSGRALPANAARFAAQLPILCARPQPAMGRA